MLLAWILSGLSLALTLGLALLVRREWRKLRDLLTPLYSRQEQLLREMADSQNQLKSLGSKLLGLEQGFLRELRAQELRELGLTARVEALEEQISRMDSRWQVLEASLSVDPRDARAEQGSYETQELSATPLVEEVLSLLASGEKPEVIARQKGMQMGEIMLIQNLSKFAGRMK